jgi:hypothetical protein
MFHPKNLKEALSIWNLCKECIFHLLSLFWTTT